MFGLFILTYLRNLKSTVSLAVASALKDEVVKIGSDASDSDNELPPSSSFVGIKQKATI